MDDGDDTSRLARLARLMGYLSGIGAVVAPLTRVFGIQSASTVHARRAGTIDEIEPRLFSFNNPFGACPACDGLGTTLHFDPALTVPDTSKRLSDGAIRPWANSTSPYYRQTLDSLAKHFGISMRTPFASGIWQSA